VSAVTDQVTFTLMLVDVDGGSEIRAVHDGPPPGVSTVDTKPAGEALAKLASLVEAPR
jgi:hypothetical protein